MVTQEIALERAEQLIKSARAAGADAADAIFVADGSTEVQIRLGNLEDVERSEGEEIGLRVFVGQRSATVSTSDLSDAALADLASRATEMAREAPEDPYAGLAPKELLATEITGDIEGDDGQDIDPATLRELATAVEDAARAVDGVTNSNGGSASASRATIALVTSDGFAGSYSSSGYGISASVLAGDASGMETDYAYHSTRHFDDLDSPEAIGREAGERTVKRLGAGKVKSGPMPVIFDPRVGSSMLGHFMGAISGAAIARKTSFLLDALDTNVFDSAITIIDCPHRRRGLRSKLFDGEGLPTAKAKLIDNGRLTQWIADSASARQLGIAPTGHASRGVGGAPGVSPTNLHMCKGSVSRTELMADIEEGIFVTDLIGHGVNGVTGDYSRGASGFVIRGGELGEPVSEITIAGNLKDMFKSLTAADDLQFRYGSNVPTLRCDAMTVAGD